MKARAWFARFTNLELVRWWGQYGRASQASYYRQVARRVALNELRRRGLRPSEAWHYLTEWPR